MASAPAVNLCADLQRQMFLGDVDFNVPMQAWADPAQVNLKEAKAANVAKLYRNSPLKWADWVARCATREEALLMAYRRPTAGPPRPHRESGISTTALAAELGMPAARVSQLIRRAEGQGWIELRSASLGRPPCALSQCTLPSLALAALAGGFSSTASASCAAFALAT